MQTEALYEIIRDIVCGFGKTEPAYKPLPAELDLQTSLDDLGLDLITLPEVLEELRARLDGKGLNLSALAPEEINSFTLGGLLKRIQDVSQHVNSKPIVVYVDDEEENLFVFKRRFGKDLDLRTFSDSREALDFIRTESNVSLVITDEVMPNLGGNALCSEVRKIKPYLKFILITGNPNSDNDLMYKSLKHGRFYEFLNKPLDLQGKGDDYLVLIKNLISGKA